MHALNLSLYLAFCEGSLPLYCCVAILYMLLCAYLCIALEIIDDDSFVMYSADNVIKAVDSLVDIQPTLPALTTTQSQQEQATAKSELPNRPGIISNY